MNASTYPQFTPSSGHEIAQRRNYLLRNLLVIFVVQVLVTLGIYVYQRNAQPDMEAKALLDFNMDNIDKWIISDANNKVMLTKSEHGWQLPDLHQLPVDSQKFDNLVDNLKGTRLTWPATTTEASHERFEVAEIKFQRRLEFFSGDKKVGDIFLGTSPGFKKVHLRRAEDNEVYAVELSTFEFSTINKDWLNTSLLTAKQPEKIIGADYQLEKNGENWRLAGDASADVDSSKVNALVEAISGFTVQDLYTGTPQGERVKISVKTPTAEWQYEFIKAGSDYFVKRNDRDLYFKVSADEYERLAQIKKQDLLAVQQSNNAAQPSDSTNTASNK